MTNFSVPLGPCALQGALDVLEPVTESAYQICAGFGPGRFEQFRVGGQIVGGRERLERIAGHEIQRALVVPGDARHARPGLVPPVDVVAIAVRVDVEGPLRPCIAGEAGIALCRRQRLAAGGLQRKGPVVEHLGGRILQDLALFGRILGKVQIPIPPGIGVDIGRQTAGHGSQLSAQRALQLGWILRVRR